MIYLSPDMVEIGLKDGQEWPSETHRNIAIHFCIENPNIGDADQMTQVVQWVLTLPEDVKELKLKDYPEEILDVLYGESLPIIKQHLQLVEACQELFDAPHYEHFCTRLNTLENAALEKIQELVGRK